MARATNYFAWQSRLVLRHLGRRVVEVGCGIGNFTGMLLDRDVVVAVDVEPACVQSLRERYPDQPNLHAFVAEDIRGLARFAPDSVVCLNVLEHIADDGEALRRMASILSPGGVIVLLVPAFPALFGPIDRNLGHYRRYTRKSLANLAEACGLHVRMVDQCPRSAAGGTIRSADRTVRPCGCAGDVAGRSMVAFALRPVASGGAGAAYFAASASSRTFTGRYAASVTSALGF
jgi:SAM-dependent methyltransferase